MISGGMAGLAFDRKSVRSVDADGRLHVSVTNISKANICPYQGKEIPDWQDLGLDPDRVYNLLRDPDELAAAAPTFNNLPILDRHVPVSAEDHQPEMVIGSTGTDATFSDPYLQNSAVLWSGDAIGDVQTEQRRQWSCAYRYTPDMTPGKFRGLQYDGVMRNIIGNHVALVDEGRAGPDVMIGDCSMLKSRKALFLHGALTGLCLPKLAADAQLDIAPLLKDLTADNLAARKGKLSVAIVAAVTPLLAQDEGLDIEDVVQVIEAVQGSGEAGEVDVIPDAEPDASGIDPPAKDDGMAALLTFLAGKLSDEDMATARSMSTNGGQDCDPDAAADEDDDDEDDKKDKAMDRATVKRMITGAVDRVRTETETATVARMNAIEQAKRDVAPYIGEVTGAMDSADAVYKLALIAADVKLDGVEPSAFRHMVGLLPKPSGTGEATRLAADRAGGDKGFRERYPTAGKLVRA